MALSPGAHLGTYEIIAKIGEGGMGEVWRARDTKLDRDVAVKILPEAVAADPERLARFEREAKTLAALNHPNIAHIYGLEGQVGQAGQVGRSSDAPCLVMELVEGEDVSQRIAHGSIPIDEALPIAKQIAEALEAAHEQGIIHRDLKPANIKVRPDGTVKVLDFGLAKPLERPGGSGESGGPGLSISPTITTPAPFDLHSGRPEQGRGPMTAAGLILGTAAYMSPEQARGKPVDKRADIWAFGCVLYELLTGRRAFEGEDVSETVADVMRVEPAWEPLRGQLSPSLLLFLKRCLQKDRRQRLGDIHDMRLALEGAFETVVDQGEGFQPPVPPSTWRWAVSGTAGIALGAAVALTFVWRPPDRADAEVARFVANTAPNPPVAAFLGAGTDLAISPDGQTIAYVTDAGLYVRPVDRLEGTLLAGTQEATNPVFSPDGNAIAFQSLADFSVKRIPVSGGPIVTVADNETLYRGASWGADGRILLGADRIGGGLLSVPATGGVVEPLTKPDTGTHAWPRILPGGQAALLTIANGPLVADKQIALLDLATLEMHPIIRPGSNAAYASTGHIIYGTRGTLFAVAFSLERLEVIGDPVPVLEGVLTKDTAGAAEFSLADTGSLAYVSGNSIEEAGRTLLWIDRAGNEKVVPEVEPRQYVYPRISPDGSRVALDVRGGAENDILIWSVNEPRFRRLSLSPAADQYPVWTPDSQQVLFDSDREGLNQIFVRESDGTGQAQRMTHGELAMSPRSITPDGARLVLQVQREGQFDLDVMDLESGALPIPLVSTGFNERYAEISPDGRWLAYESDETGRDEIWVARFPDVTAGRWQVTSDGGRQPLWNPRGGELFYRGPRGLAVVPVRTGEDAFGWEKARVLFSDAYFNNGLGRSYDITPDGQRFLVVKQESAARPDAEAKVVFIQHWSEELKRLVPVD